MTEQEQKITQQITTFFVETFGVCPRRVRILTQSVISQQKSKAQMEQIVALIKSHGSVTALKCRIDKIEKGFAQGKFDETVKTL